MRTKVKDEGERSRSCSNDRGSKINDSYDHVKGRMTSTQQQISKANNSNKGCRYIRHRLLRNDVNVNFHWRSAGMADKSNFEKNLPNSQVDIRRPAGKIRKTPSDLDLQIRIKNLEEINLVDDSGEKCVTLKRYLIINLFYGRRNWRDSHCWKKDKSS